MSASTTVVPPLIWLSRWSISSTCWGHSIEAWWEFSAFCYWGERGREGKREGGGEREEGRERCVSEYVTYYVHSLYGIKHCRICSRKFTCCIWKSALIIATCIYKVFQKLHKTTFLKLEWLLCLWHPIIIRLPYNHPDPVADNMPILELSRAHTLCAASAQKCGTCWRPLPIYYARLWAWAESTRGCGW